MWKCPECGNVNENDVCINCGMEKPQVPQDTMKMDSVNDKSNKTIYIVIITILIAAIIICVACFGLYVNKANNNDELDFTNEPVNENITGVEKTTGVVDVAEGDTDKNITAVYTGRNVKGDIIRISGTSMVAPEIMTLAEPDRLVLDFYGYTHTLSGTSADKSGDCYNNIRYANHDGYARFVFDLSQDCVYSIETNEYECIIELTGNNTEDVYSDEVREILNIFTAETTEGDIVRIAATSYTVPEIMELENPKRLVLDFYGYTSVMNGDSLDRAGNCYSNIRYANHEGYTRVVIDMKDDYTYTTYGSNNEFVITLSAE